MAERRMGPPHFSDPYWTSTVNVHEEFTSSLDADWTFSGIDESS